MTLNQIAEIHAKGLADVTVQINTVPKGYKQTEVGLIPEDWNDAFIGEVCHLLTGFPFPSSQYSNSGVRLLRGSNVKRNCTDWTEEITQYWPKITSSVKQYELVAGDIVISMDGSLVGRSFAQLSEADLPALLLQRVARLRSEIVSQDYLKEWVCSKFFTEHCDSLKTVTAIPHISPQDIRSFKFVLPSTKEEQTAIATALSDTEALINKLEKLILKKQAIKTATMQLLLTGRTRLLQFALREDGSKKGYKQSELGDIPEDWEICELKDAVDFLDGLRRPVKSGDRAKIRGIYPYYGASGIVDYVNDFIFDDELILLGEDGENILSRNLPLAFKVSGKIWVNNHAHVMKPKSDFDITYLTEFLESLDYSLLNSGTAQPKLNKQSCLKIKVAKPSKKEQSAIAIILSDMDDELRALEQRLNKNRQIKQGMMQELLTGKTRLVKPEDDHRGSA